MAELTPSISCKAREASTKGAARRLRSQGLVPAVAYGPKQEPLYLSIDPNEFVPSAEKFGLAQIYDVSVEGGVSFKALIKDLQRDPVKHTFKHIDLYAVDMTQPLRVHVHVDLKGKPAGAVNGGLLNQVLRSLEIECLPDIMPHSIDVDVTALDIGDSLHVSEIAFPEGVTYVGGGDPTVAVMVAPGGGAEEEEEEAKPAEGEAVAAPVEGEAKPKE